MGERETGKRVRLMWERNISWLPPVYALTGDWTWNLGMYPAQESNLQPFGYGMMLQPTEQPSQGKAFLNWVDHMAWLYHFAVFLISFDTCPRVIILSPFVVMPLGVNSNSLYSEMYCTTLQKNCINILVNKERITEWNSWTCSQALPWKKKSPQSVMFLFTKPHRIGRVSQDK